MCSNLVPTSIDVSILRRRGYLIPARSNQSQLYLPSGGMLSAQLIHGQHDQGGDAIFKIICSSVAGLDALRRSLRSIGVAYVRSELRGLLRIEGGDPRIRLNNIRHYMTRRRGEQDAYDIDVSQTISIILQSRGVGPFGGARGASSPCSTCEAQMQRMGTAEPAPFMECGGAFDTCGNCDWDEQQCSLETTI